MTIVISKGKQEMVKTDMDINNHRGLNNHVYTLRLTHLTEFEYILSRYNLYKEKQIKEIKYNKLCYTPL